MSFVRIYFWFQFAVVTALGLYVYHQYNMNEPVTKLLVDSTKMTISHGMGRCDQVCFQTWRDQTAKSPQTQVAIKKAIKWLSQSPRTLKFIFRQMSLQTQTQILIALKTTKSNPEAAKMFETAYGANPDLLYTMLTN